MSLKDINKELKNLVKEIDNRLGKYALSEKESMKGVPVIRWTFISLFIIFNLLSILYYLYEIYVIININDAGVDKSIKELEQNDKLFSLMSNNFTELRCHKKKMCCFVASLLRILQSVITIVFYLYIGMKGKLFIGWLLSTVVYIAVGYILYLFIDDKESVEMGIIMCPMPMEYRKFFEGFDEKDKDVKKDKIKYSNSDNGYYQQF